MQSAISDSRTVLSITAIKKHKHKEAIKMKIVVLLAVIVLAQGYPSPDTQDAELIPEPSGPDGLDGHRPESTVQPPTEEDNSPRFKRATCDLMSFQSKWVTPNHAACAAHCLAKGFKGGKCQGTICHCRDKIKWG
uniref:Defensin n=1 Tax=Corythucha ciliata TaxID=369451 RepID=A0A1Z1JMZ0_CORCT|nr:defensin [Corythucha ciliata]